MCSTSGDVKSMQQRVIFSTVKDEPDFSRLLQQPGQAKMGSCLQISRFTESFVSRKPIKIIEIYKMLLKQSIISYILV